MVNKKIKEIEKRQKRLGHSEICQCDVCLLLMFIRVDSAVIGGNRRTIKKLRKQVKESRYTGALKAVRFGEEL